MGSIAYKLALIASSDADATFTLVPKNEWDICAGVLLVTEAGGTVTHLDGTPAIFNQPKTLLQGLIASNGLLHSQLLDLVARRHGKSTRIADESGS
jgi:myo-inositol-1(or 4)-monophosphatase